MGSSGVLQAAGIERIGGLQRAEHPGLFTVLDGLAQGIDAPPVDEVVLDADFNAGAVLVRRR